MTLPCTLTDRDNQSYVECQGKPAKRVKVCSSEDDPVYVNPVEDGSRVRVSFIGDTSSEGTIIDNTTAVGKLRKYTQIIFVCRKTVSFKVKNNGEQILSARLGPANPTVAIKIEYGENVIAGQNITVELIKSFSTPDVPVEVYLRGGELDA